MNRRPPLSFVLIDVLRGMHSLKWHRRLKSNENLSCRELEDYQIIQLKKLIDYVSKHVPYYIDYLDKNRLSSNDFNKIKDLEQLPIITKKIIRNDPLQFRSLDFNEKKHFRRSTSGATGEPFVYYLDRNSFSFNRAYRLKSWECFGYRMADKYCTISGSALIDSKGKSLNLRGYNLLENRMACCVKRLDEKTCVEIFNKIIRERPLYIFGYPSLIYEFAIFVEETKRRIDFIKKVVTTSECLQEEERKYIERVFSTEIYDFYGCGDGTVVACECEEHNGLHYGMEGCILECVNSNGFQNKDGIEGRLLATSLTNYQMPFLRYDTSDLGWLERGCACGRNSVKIGKIVGRDRDQIVCMDGSLIHGANINKIAIEHRWISRFQVVQQKNRHITMIIEQKYYPKDAEKQLLIDNLKRLLGGISVSVSFTDSFTDSFIYTKAGKFRSIISFADRFGNRLSS